MIMNRQSDQGVYVKVVDGKHINVVFNGTIFTEDLIHMLCVAVHQ